jgi:serine/threonine-protein kinase
MMIEELPKVRRFQLEYSSVASVSRPAAAVADWSSEVMAHFEKKEYQSAEIAAHRQFTANKDPYAFLLMVQAAARDGRHFDCLKYLERHPGQSQPPAKYADELRRISVDAQLAVRSIDAAEKTINQLITEGREDRVLLLKKASVLGLQARFDEARELLLDLNRRYSGNPAILKRLVIVNEQLRDFSKAAAFLRALRELAPNDAWANSKWANYKALGAA